MRKIRYKPKQTIFHKRYSKLGQEIDESMKIKPSFRVNTLKITEEELISRLSKKRIRLDKIDWLENGYYYKSYFSLGATPEYLSGLYYLQEAASQFSVEVLDPKPGEVVLDMCAAPGGKTTQIAQLMNNKGKVVAIDNHKRRLFALKNNIQRTGVTNSVLYYLDAAKVDKLGIKFDKILLDAPCSGNFVTDKDWLNKRDIEGIQKNAKLQKQLLTSAMNSLKKDGVLIYSTCSLEPEENELNIHWLMDNFDTKIEQIDVKIGSKGLIEVFGKRLRPEISRTRRFWPNLTETQGFYIAKVRKV
jgi:NOL1/NOP2/sun family putative RNA methylase